VVHSLSFCIFEGDAQKKVIFSKELHIFLVTLVEDDNLHCEQHPTDKKSCYVLAFCYLPTIVAFEANAEIISSDKDGCRSQAFLIKVLVVHFFDSKMRN
jgi:hypothetical protein